MTPETYRNAVAQAEAAAMAYYDGDGARLHMTDAEYDSLIDQIAAYEQAHPGDAVPHRLTTAVAAGVSAGGDVPHPRPMLSLDKITDDPDGAAAFIRKVTAHGGAVTVEPKLDGMAVRVVYTEGTLVQIITRGDGTAGEDVTRQYRAIDGQPISGLPADVGDTGFTGEVRGEVFMTETDLEASNMARVAAGKPAFANPRNATAGSLRREDPTYAVRMSFAAYDIDTDMTGWDRHTVAMAHLEALGFRTAQALMPDHNPKTLRNAATNDAKVAVARIAALAEARATLGFPIDGAVIAVDDYTQRTALGVGSRSPKWALAYKYPADEVTSVLRDVEVTVGRTGRISLRARIDPVEVDGTTITYATLHSPSWVEAQQIGIGSRVAVKRAGDVIPRITGGLAGDDSTVAQWQAPDECPSCGESWDKASLLWRCRGGCGTAPAVSYFTSRDCADIEGMSDAISTALVEAGKINDIADLYDLSVDDIASTPLGTTETGAPRLIGVTVAAKLHEQITRSKGQPFAKILAGVGLRGTGRSLSRRLANHFGSLDAIRAASVDELTAVEGIGVEKARLIHDELVAKGDVLDRLAAAGVKTTVDAPARAATGENAAAPAAAAGAVLAGKTVVITGAMSGPLAALKRNDMNELVETHGGKSSGSVSTKTSLLVCGEEGSSKYLKARELGVEILSPEQFAALIGYPG